MTARVRFCPRWGLVFLSLGFAAFAVAEADSDPTHVAAHSKKPRPWPDGIVSYDISKLTEDQQKTVLNAMQRWTDTGARVQFVPRSNQVEYVYFTGKTDAGNNTSGDGFHKGTRIDVNITAFWWRQGEWMPAHELGHVLGFHHEHQRWDRDQYVTIHYEHIKAGRQHDYDWIPKTNWIVSSTQYDYRSIMHYRTCWASSCEPQCKDGDGGSPCAVIDPWNELRPRHRPMDRQRHQHHRWGEDATGVRQHRGQTELKSGTAWRSESRKPKSEGKPKSESISMRTHPRHSDFFRISSPDAPSPLRSPVFHP